MRGLTTVASINVGPIAQAGRSLPLFFRVGATVVLWNALHLRSQGFKTAEEGNAAHGKVFEEVNLPSRQLGRG